MKKCRLGKIIKLIFLNIVWSDISKKKKQFAQTANGINRHTESTAQKTEKADTNVQHGNYMVSAV